MKLKKAFTLIEIIVVITIITIVSLFSVLGIISFKANTEVNAVYSDLTSSLKSLQNRAVNSISYADPDIVGVNNFQAPDLYAIRFFEDGYKFYICNKISSSSTNVRCEEDKITRGYTLPSGISINSRYGSLGYTLLEGDLAVIALNAFEDEGNSGGFFTKPNAIIQRFNEITVNSNQFDIRKTIVGDILYDKFDY